MFYRYALLFVSLILLFSCEEQTESRHQEFQTRFETSEGLETATYLETIEFYIRLAREFPDINIQTIGETDSGKPLHLVTYNPDATFNFQKIREDNVVVLINNGIHPGESDGIDATMLLYRDLALGRFQVPDNVVLATIPIYNVGGALNRNSHTRANQNGPKSYGFRGNARNYDLNRDFIKMDTKNTETFSTIFHLVKPDIFIDNHVSNGADYSYYLTHLFTQADKMGGKTGAFVREEWLPALETMLMEKGWDITPYVNVFNRPPDGGFGQFMDYPRYSTGYTTLWNTPGMMLETHMLKPYDKRVAGTYEVLKAVIAFASENQANLKEIRQADGQRLAAGDYYPVRWVMDTLSSSLSFKGFEADTLISEVTGLPRLKYNPDRPFTKTISYYDRYKATDSVRIPEAYIIPAPWKEVLHRLEVNQIRLQILDRDSVMSIEQYRIEDFSTYDSPYEGHYPHYNTKISTTTKRMTFNAGDVIIPTDQPGIRYLLETLEPQANDSFFNWNFFDTRLQRKEGFSPYVFEDKAKEILEKDSLLQQEFNLKKKEDTAFAKRWYEQLNWIFERSEYYEPAHNTYPVYRVMAKS